MRPALVLLVASASACSSVEAAPALVCLRLGPARAHLPRHVVALPATCGSLELAAKPVDPNAPPPARPWVDPCADGVLAGVDAGVRSALEFAGYDVIDSEQVVARTLAHSEVDTTDRGRGFEQGQREIVRIGSRFADAPPALQDAILGELGADGVLNTRIWLGAGVGDRPRVEVQVRLLHVPDGTLAWARRCELEVGDLETGQAAIGRAANCAAEDVPR